MSGVGVVLMTYGAPRDLDDVAAYLERVRGRPPTEDLVREMRRRYATIGGSPLVRITQEQARALEGELGASHRVVAGMRFSSPSVDDAVASLAASGCERAVGICLSPQWSAGLMGGYTRAFDEACERHLPGRPRAMAGAWHREPLFVDSLAARLREALDGLEGSVPVLLTAHSLPKRVFDAEPGYVAQLRETADLVAARAGLAPDRWRWAYQSAGHTAEEWLRPDLKELFPALAAAGARDVLVAPMQFLADHLEVLYDLDVAARAEAEAAGLRYHRIAMPNASPAFIRALAAVARREDRAALRVADAAGAS